MSQILSVYGILVIRLKLSRFQTNILRYKVYVWDKERVLEEHIQSTTEEIQEPQEETFDFISAEDAERRAIRTRMDPAIYSKYANAIMQVNYESWCHITTQTFTGTRSNLLKVAAKMSKPLLVEKTSKGLQFRLATEAEVEARKKGGRGKKKLSSPPKRR